MGTSFVIAWRSKPELAGAQGKKGVAREEEEITPEALNQPDALSREALNGDMANAALPGREAVLI
jgi:hypothetical protein